MNSKRNLGCRLILFVMLGATIALPNHAQRIQTRGRSHSALSAGRNQEYQKILERARSIGSRLRSEDPHALKQARADWARLRSDLHAWARKYNVRLVTREIKHDLRGTAPSTRPDFGSVTIGKRFPNEKDAYCDNEVEINGKVCVLDPQRSGRAGADKINCVYECPEPPKEPDKK